MMVGCRWIRGLGRRHRRCSYALTALALAIGAATHADAQQPFPEFLRDVEAQARAQGVSDSTLARAVTGLRPDLSLLEPPRPNPSPIPSPSANPNPNPNPTQSGERTEGAKSPLAYLEAGQLTRLVTTGRALARTYATTLQQIEAQLGVDGAVLLAVWGRETAFGTLRLPYDAISLLATQAWRGQQRDAARAELIAALRLLQAGLPRSALRASASGAIGLTQMMPSEVLAHGMDMDGDGRIDLAGSVPDALASMARRLQAKGWVRGLRWGFEVKATSRELCMQEGPSGIKPLAAWSKLGVTRVATLLADEPSGSTRAYLLQPAGLFGPAFLVTDNFTVLLRSTAGEAPALSIATLADRIAGSGDFATPLQSPPQLAPREIEAVQRGLQSWGFAVESESGKIDSATRVQVGAYQKSMGILVTCWPTPHLLEHIRQATRAREESAAAAAAQAGQSAQAQGDVPAAPPAGAGTRSGWGATSSIGRDAPPGARPASPGGPMFGATGPGR